jgi:hypothetical protein
VTPLLLYVGVTFIVDDPAGAAIPVSVSHFTSNLNMTTKQISQLLPIGTILAIREPYVSVDHQSRAGPCSGKPDQGIRVDSPTDIIVWKGGDEIDLLWKEKVDASEQGEQTRWMCPVDLLEGKGQCSSEEVLRCVDELLSDDRPGEAYRLISKGIEAGISIGSRIQGIVLFHLDAWEAARTQFALDEQKGNSASSNGVQEDERVAANYAINITALTSRQAKLRCQLRIHQASAGISTADMSSIFFAAANGTARLDISTYIGPVAVRVIPGAGRGLVTTRTVKPGELLLCSKAICPSYPYDAQCRGSPLLRLNLDNGVVSSTSQVLAQTKLIHSIVGES